MDKHTYCFYTVSGEHLMFDAAMLLDLGEIIKLFKDVDDQEPYVKLFGSKLIGWEKVR